ncbi:MAG: hypothetical protein AAF744_00460 [Pseudomonadota bacterium]
MTLNALLLTPESQAADTDTSIYTGAGVSLFSSGSAPKGTDMLVGDGLELFTTSCIEEATQGSLFAGEGVQMFTTSCLAEGTDTQSGDKVALFTTSC